ncbi:hypothetical protein BKA82DRAFT_133541 [Pisolithus tinctorius]|uniref:Uncharacterized protein n=1 Tax=Pisolithus tinctorius Marx 270 TaxID=870435 RepID=A0A0C3PJH7_PISTI|nr:hypothetical protein BKA82DRAFT_133541 [Pisolithus tinctorius]KIO08761.1 hypothetical protein M404DRAFT_133541 [Pisolithus tinctorius Marx 270]
MHATWLKNHSSTRHLGTKTPYEMLYQRPPDLSKIPVWGCHVKVHDTSGSKLDMQAQDGHWVGFDPESNGHCIYLSKSDNTPGSFLGRTIGIERSVIFKCWDVSIPHGVPLEGEQGNSDASERNSEASEQNSTASQGNSEACYAHNE